MKETGRVSALMLERYRLGEVSAAERKLIEAELSLDRALRLRYEALEDSDRELRRLYPWEQSPLKSLPALAGLQDAAPARETGSFRRMGFGRGQVRTGRRLLGLCAAAVFLCVLFPSLYYLQGRAPVEGSGVTKISGVPETGSDRVKGTEVKTELSIYLKEAPAPGPADGARKLPDRTPLGEGSTVQLAYATPPGDVYYGVIFSIDGRSAVTMHYPYRKEQSPVLTAGKQTFLNEAYTLDDAPDFEIFFMVVSQNPLDTGKVLKTARELAEDPKTALAKSTAAFSGCEVETITIRK